jgi:transcriptional regulator with XRE-family HTH domain
MTISAKPGLRMVAAENGMSINRLARETGITRVQLSRIASGENTSPGTAGKIAKALNRTVVDLFDIQESD